MGLSPGPGITLNGHNFMSLCTEASLNLLPINLLASAWSTNLSQQLKNVVSETEKQTKKLCALYSKQP